VVVIPVRTRVCMGTLGAADDNPSSLARLTPYGSKPPGKQTAVGAASPVGAASAAMGCSPHRINVDFPNSDSTRSTASFAVWFRLSNAGFSSTMSSEPTRPVSAIISMHSCASR